MEQNFLKRLLVVNLKYDGVEGQREEEGERERKEGKGEAEKEGVAEGEGRGVVTQFRPLLN